MSVHVVSMIFGQLTHALSLNELCGTLKFVKGALSTIRNTTSASRNGLSHANAVRSSAYATFVNF